MYDIYISNYKDSSGNFVSSEHLLYSIPITDPDLAFIDPVIKVEMGKAGSFEFSVNPVHAYYNAWCQMKTVMRVTYDGTTIFRGRVLTIDNTPLTGVKKIHLEGDFAFLMDSWYKGIKKDEDRPTITCLAYLQQLINNHNSQMNLAGEGYKQIRLGEVPGQYSSSTSSFQRISVESRKYGDGNYQKTADALSGLQREYGGYFRTRYVNGLCYLDWIDYCFNSVVSNQAIEIQDNLIDLSSTTEVDNLFTALIPIGSNEGKDVTIKGYRTNVHGDTEYILVPQIVSLFPDSELNKGFHSKVEYQNAVNNYGIIFATQTFSNADTQEKLFNYAIDFIKNNYVGGISNFSISALDKHHIDPNTEKYLVGDQVWVIYPNINLHTSGTTPTIQKKLVLTSITYNLYNPENNDYSVGIPVNILNKTYGTPNTGTKTSGGGSPSTAVAAGAGGRITRQDTEQKMTVKEMDDLAWRYVVDGYYNNDKYKALKKENPKAAQKAINFSEAVVLRTLMDKEDPNHEYTGGTQAKIQSIYIDGMNSRIKLAGYLPGWAAEKEKDNILKEMGLSESVVLDGFVGEWSIQDHLDFSQSEHIPVVWTDEAKAKYITWKNIKAKPLLTIKRNQKENISGVLDTLAEIKTNTLKNLLPSPDDPTGRTNANYYGSMRADGGSGVLYAFGGAYGPSVDDPTSVVIENDGLNGVTKYFNRLDLGNIPSAQIDALKGQLSDMKVLVGINGSEDGAVIDIDGLRSGISMKNVIDAGSQDPKKITVDLTGEDGALGLGKDNGDNWIVTANKKITYSDTDEQGHIVIHVINGGIHAQDFHVNSIGSFATKFAAIDTLIAKKAFISDLEAERARITDLEVTTGDMQADLATIEGSALWTRRDNITGVVGNFEIKQDSSGKDILVVKSGGGFRINRDNVEYGIYDNGNLTGGVVVDKINANSTVTKIKGDRVDITAKQVRIGNDTTTVENWMNSTDTWKNSTDETLDEYEGLIANRATIYQLNSAIANVEELIADEVSAESLNAKIATIPTLTGIAASFSGNVSASGILANDGLYMGTGSGYENVNTAIKQVRINPSGNSYTLQYKTFASDWTDAGTFSRATTLSGTWSGGTLTVNASPQNQSITFGLSDVPKADVTWSGNEASFPVKANVNGGENFVRTGKTLKIDASSRYNAGWNYGATTGKFEGSATTLPHANKTLDYGESWLVSFVRKKSDGSEVSSNYVVKGPPDYTPVDITLQGASTTCYVLASSGGDLYYKASSPVTYYKAGSTKTLYAAGTSGGYARGASVSGTNRGSTSQTYTYKLVYDKSGTSQGYHWVSSNSTGGSTMYTSGSAYTYYKGDGGYHTYQGSSGSYTIQGDAISLTPINRFSEVRLQSGVTRYLAGTRYNKNKYYVAP